MIQISGAGREGAFSEAELLQRAMIVNYLDPVQRELSESGQFSQDALCVRIGEALREAAAITGLRNPGDPTAEVAGFGWLNQTEAMILRQMQDLTARHLHGDKEPVNLLDQALALEGKSGLPSCLFEPAIGRMCDFLGLPTR